ncbi:MAG: tRNA (adenosine(37)-N6)-dimethylallyltransferase MiaA, partial [Tepidisphaeraceae bacterium]
HVNDTKRLVRALEILELTGTPISKLQTQWKSDHTRHHAIWFGLAWTRDELNRRINARVRSMIELGWLEETRRLGRGLSKTASEATGYRELRQVVEQNVSLDDAVEQIKVATRQLARRQMKWLRRFAGVTWLPGSAGADANASEMARASEQ